MSPCGNEGAIATAAAARDSIKPHCPRAVTTLTTTGDQVRSQAEVSPKAHRDLSYHHTQRIEAKRSLRFSLLDLTSNAWKISIALFFDPKRLGVTFAAGPNSSFQRRTDRYGRYGCYIHPNSSFQPAAGEAKKITTVSKCISNEKIQLPRTSSNPRQLPRQLVDVVLISWAGGGMGFLAGT